MVAPALVPVLVTTAVLTLKSDTKPVSVYVKNPKGTLYWGGAGLDGDYIYPTTQAFRNAGIKNISVGLNNTATKHLPKEPGMIVDAIRAGLTVRYEDSDDWTISSGMTEGEQFNLIGYSYGSLLAAQTANFYAKQGVIIDHLVLIASPIDGDFLRNLKSNKNIKQVYILNLTSSGDYIYAGISQVELLNPFELQKLQADMSEKRGNGHFYYAHTIPALQERLNALASILYKYGLR
jgi:uncharacterized protein YaiE (UPF0345 family)